MNGSTSLRRTVAKSNSIAELETSHSLSCHGRRRARTSTTEQGRGTHRRATGSASGLSNISRSCRPYKADSIHNICYTSYRKPSKKKYFRNGTQSHILQPPVQPFDRWLMVVKLLTGWPSPEADSIDRPDVIVRYPSLKQLRSSLDMKHVHTMGLQKQKTTSAGDK